MPAKKRRKSSKPKRIEKGKNVFLKTIGILVGAAFVMLLYFLFLIPSRQTVSHIADSSSLGTFSGTLPCADCSGLDVSMTFTVGNENEPNTYTETDSYQGKDVTYTTTGTWEYETGTQNDPKAVVIKVTPDGSAQSQYYLVVDKDHIQLLSSEKEVIDSPFNETLTRK